MSKIAFASMSKKKTHHTVRTPASRRSNKVISVLKSLITLTVRTLPREDATKRPEKTPIARTSSREVAKTIETEIA